MKLQITERKPRIVLFAGDNMVSEWVEHFLVEECRENVVAIFGQYDDSLVTPLSIEAELGITCYWPYLINKETIALFKYGIINFHPSLLPKNRGWYPAVWQILDLDRVAGVTLHLIDEGVDTGPIIAQRQWDIKETDTGHLVYGKSQLQIFELFKEVWFKLKEEGIELTIQNHKESTFHSKREGNDCDEIDIDQMYNAGYLIDLIKAKTFKHKGYAFYRKNGKKYYLQIQVTEQDE